MAAPDVIMFIRHGEKPGDNGTPKGVDHHGEHDAHSLSVRGWTRAGALAALFSQLPNANQPTLVTPGRVIATKSTDSYKSKREVDTATPLAKRLGITVDQSFDHSHLPQVTASILGNDHPTLVVWHHGSMSELLKGFPISNAADVPKAWPDDRFDEIWVLTKAQDGQYAFTQTQQALLDGDVALS